LQPISEATVINHLLDKNSTITTPTVSNHHSVHRKVESTKNTGIRTMHDKKQYKDFKTQSQMSHRLS